MLPLPFITQNREPQTEREAVSLNQRDVPLCELKREIERGRSPDRSVLAVQTHTQTQKKPRHNTKVKCEPDDSAVQSAVSSGTGLAAATDKL